jgi:hypothetical protein
MLFIIQMGLRMQGEFKKSLIVVILRTTYFFIVFFFSFFHFRDAILLCSISYYLMFCEDLLIN